MKRMLGLLLVATSVFGSFSSADAYAASGPKGESPGAHCIYKDTRTDKDKGSPQYTYDNPKMSYTGGVVYERALKGIGFSTTDSSR